MKKFIAILFIAVLGVSCDEETRDVSRVTNYPLLELNGDAVVFLNQGDTYEELGIIATENGEEIEYTTTINGRYRGGSSVDTNVADLYEITYSAENSDGFTGSVTRTVYVIDNGDLVSSIAGLYLSTVTRNGSLTAQYTDMEYVFIWENTDGTFGMSDGFGGYYSIGRAYGPTYDAGPVVITANSIPGNSFTVPPFTGGAFGDAAEMSNIVVNPGAQTINFTTNWEAGFTFAVLLEKVQF